jgi:hypothetical protein
MAKPVQPIVPGIGLPVTVYGENQPECENLPAFRLLDGTTLSRWRLTWRERLLVLLRGDVYLWLLTNNRPLQPVLIQIERPEQGDIARSQERARRGTEALPPHFRRVETESTGKAGRVALGAIVMLLAGLLVFIISARGQGVSFAKVNRKVSELAAIAPDREVPWLTKQNFRALEEVKK